MSAFPISALVGADDLQLALILGAIDRRIGGVLLRGDKGSAKSTAARGLAAVLPGDAPFVELPLGATEDRVAGSFDVRAALGTGEYRYRPGLLEEADGGVLYVDEVNLLPDHLVDLLLDAAATGTVRVERDGMSETRAARFVLIGSMNPEEGELRPQLLDRFGLSVAVIAPGDPAMRGEAVRRRLAYDADSVGMAGKWADTEQALATRLAAARPARLDAAVIDGAAGLCVAAGVEGLRADLVICRAAAALAGWEGRADATMADVERVAPLALAHRRGTPWDPSPPARSSSPPPGRSGTPMGPNSPGPGTGRDTGPGSRQRTGTEPGQSAGGGEPEPGAPGDGAGVAPQPAGEPATASATPTGGPATAPMPPGRGPAPTVPQASHVEQPNRAESPDPIGIGIGVGVGGRRRVGGAIDAPRGRLVGSRVPDSSHALAGVHATATVLAAAGRYEGPGPVQLVDADVREPVRRQVPASLVVLVVDTSGSMGVRARLSAAREAILALLIDAYQRRDRVALVTFRGDRAETVLRPTGSTEVARTRLASIATGGRTPLAAGIRVGLDLAVGRRHAADRPILVVVSDGHATWADGGADPLAAALDAAEQVRRTGIRALVVDCESGPARLGLTEALARAMGAQRVVVGDVTGDALAALVRAAMP